MQYVYIGIALICTLISIASAALALICLFGFWSADNVMGMALTAGLVISVGICIASGIFALESAIKAFPDNVWLQQWKEGQ